MANTSRGSFGGGSKKAHLPEEETPKGARYSRNMNPIRLRGRGSNRIKKVIIYAVPTVFVIGVFSTVMQVNKASDLVASAEHQFSASYNPSFKVRYSDLGKQIIMNWYNQEEPVVNLAANVRWPGAPLAASSAGVIESSLDGKDLSNRTILIPDIKNVSFVEGYQSSATLDPKMMAKYPNYKNPYEELLKYYVVINNQALTVTVTLVIPDIDNPDLAPILITPPVIGASDSLGNTQSEISSNPQGVPGLSPTKLSDQANSSVNVWAQSWASNNGSGLRLTTQDKEPRVYFGLGGWETLSGSTRVNWAYNKTSDGSTKKSKADGDVVIAEVEFVMYQLNAAEEKAEGGSKGRSGINEKTQFSNVQVMDVLIHGAETGSPAIVAWGPSGTWGELTPFMNGIYESELKSNQSQNRTNSGQEGVSSGSSTRTDSNMPSSSLSPSATDRPSDSKSEEGEAKEEQVEGAPTAPAEEAEGE